MTIKWRRLCILLCLWVVIFATAAFGEDLYDELQTVEDVETAIQAHTLVEKNYLEDFDKIAESQQYPRAYRYYFNGIWLAHIREYESARENFYEVLTLLEKKSDEWLEMHTLEKLLEIDEIFGNLIDYQENAFRLRTVAAGLDDEKYMKALYAIADAHYKTYNDVIAKSYLTILYEEAEAADYAFGFSRYHMLYGDLEIAYLNYEDARYHYEKAYEYGEASEALLSLCYMDQLNLRMAKIESYDGQYEEAFSRLKKLLIDLEMKSPYAKKVIYKALGQAALDLKLPEESIAYFELALVNDYLTYKAYEVDAFEVAIYYKMALAYELLRDYETALHYFDLASSKLEVQKIYEARAKQVSALNAYEVDELQRELVFRQKLKRSNEETIALQRNYLRMGIGLIIALGSSLFVVIWLYFARGRVQKKLKIESITDHLTKVYNRGYIIGVLEENIESSTCIMMMDVDNFKVINDTFGHVFGDKVLVEIAQSIEKNLREDDYVGRYGGEEFLVVLKNTNIENGLIVAERIREASEALEWPEDVKTTLSIGILQCHEVGADDLLAEADRLMYRAKSLGKNRVVF